jgi:hypothetical protein
LALETGAGNIKIFDTAADWWSPHWTGRTETYNLWGTKEKSLALLKRQSLHSGDTEIEAFGWREMHPPIHDLESYWGGKVDGWAGLDFFFALGDFVWYDGDSICGERRGSCKVPLDERPGLKAVIDGGERLLLADSALRWARVWGYGKEPKLATIGRVNFLAWPFAEEMGKDRHGTGVLGTKTFDGAVGWQLLSSSTWNWDLCTAEFELTDGPYEIVDPGLTPLQMHRYNGHGRDTPYPSP